MTLKNRYKNAGLDVLVNILEKPDDYSDECVDVVKEELLSRKDS